MTTSSTSASSPLLLPQEEDNAFVDRNFNDIKELFQERIYGSIKGQYRFDMVLEDIEDSIEKVMLQRSHSNDDMNFTKFCLFDIGGGLGQISLHFACGKSHLQQRHQSDNINHDNNGNVKWEINYYDISNEMKQEVDRKWEQTQSERNRKSCQATNSGGTLTTNVGGIRDVITYFERIKNHSSNYNGSNCLLLVTIHAVLEWLAEPIPDLLSLLELLPHNTLLSLLYHNAIPCEKKKKKSKPGTTTTLSMDEYGVITRPICKSKINKLTPYHEFDSNHLEELIKSKGFTNILQRTGIRVKKFPRHGTHEDLLTYLNNERQIARQEPYCCQGRYNHIVAMKQTF